MQKYPDKKSISISLWKQVVVLQGVVSQGVVFQGVVLSKSVYEKDYQKQLSRRGLECESFPGLIVVRLKNLLLLFASHLLLFKARLASPP